MKRTMKILPLVMTGLGFVLLGLRSWLYAVALDHKNMLIFGHPLAVAVWLPASFWAPVTVTVQVSPLTRFVAVASGTWSWPS